MNAQPDRHIRSWTMEEIAGALRRQSRVAVVSFLALALGATTAVVAAPPLYEGTLKILVKRDRADSVISAAADDDTGRRNLEISETELMSQVELIQSNELIARVARETGLVTRVKAENPDLTEAEAESRAAAALRERLEVAPVKRTWLIDVTYEDDDRRRTAQVLDTLVQLYLEKHLALQRPAGTYEFFAAQAAVAKQELEAIRNQLASFSEEHQVVAATLEQEAALQKLSQFEAMRSEAQAALSEAERRLATLNADLRRVPKQRTASVRTDSRAITEIKSRLLSLEMQRSQLLQKFTPEYRGVQEVEAQIQQAQAALAAAEDQPVREETVADNPTRQWLETELARTRAEHAAARARVRALSSAVAQYRARAQALEVRGAEQQDLERELQAAEAKYLLYAQKQEEARISDELDRTRIANVVVAEGPSVAVEPQRDPSLALLPLLFGIALFISGGLAILVDALTPAWRSWRRDAEERRPLIGHISPSEEPLS